MATRIVTSVDERIGLIRLEGTEQLNAIGSPTYTAIAEAVRNFERDVHVRAVVIHGAGRAFSAGADIAEIGSFGERQQFHDFIHGFTDALDVLAASPLPIIAAIHGAALGGGLELALACDLRIATPDSKLGLPEAKLGVLPGAGGTQRLPRLVPLGIATEMIMSGDPISGQRAHEIGLVNHVAPVDLLLQIASERAASLGALAPQVIAATKMLLAQTAEADLADGIASEREATADLFDSPDGREGFAAFRERRTPHFTGASE